VSTAALVVGCGDDGGPAATVTTRPPVTTSDPLPLRVAESFDADDVEARCAALEGLADIDPDADPTASDVERLRAVAELAPPAVADPLLTVADYGRAVVAGEEDTSEAETAAAEASLVLVAYGLDACGLQVPLFDRLSGFDLGG
jgi:hypothetical protein